jgi:hypothetical protein
LLIVELRRFGPPIGQGITLWISVATSWTVSFLTALLTPLLILAGARMDAAGSLREDEES